MKRIISLMLSVLFPVFLLAGCTGRFSCSQINGDETETVSCRYGEKIYGNALIYTADGDVYYAENHIIRDKLTGIIIDPPEKSITDVFNESENALKKGEKVLIIYIDGLGYSAFLKAASDGDLPSLSTLNAEKSASVFPTITPVNYAAMITGKPPKENGVIKRGIHELKCPTVFDLAAELGKTSFASEGDTQILKLDNTDLELSPDLNGDGTSDDEIFECTMKVIDEYDLVFVHFHSVDDASHDFSPDSAEARDALKRVDGWCGELMNNWYGMIIITSDHGQHPQNGTGDEVYSDRSGTHGDFVPSDIFTPFLTN